MPAALHDRRVLVIGASSGIGAATARAAAASGACVAVAARRLDALEALAAELPGSVALQVDVRDEASVARMAGQVIDRFGGLDAVVYCAATSPLMPLVDAGAQDWADVLGTNVVGCALVAAAAAEHLLHSGGVFIGLSSKAVEAPFADLGLYSTSKTALDGLLRCLPVEFPGLRVTRVVVGNTHGTDFSAGWDPTALEGALGRWAQANVLGSLTTLEPAAVADAVVAVLASPAHVRDIAVLEPPAPPSGPAGSAR